MSAIIILSFFFFSIHYSNKYILSLANDYKAQVTFYTATFQNVENAQSIQNGDSGIVVCNHSTAQTVYNKLKNVVGISFCFQGDNIELKNLCESMGIKIYFQENVSNQIISYLGYCNKLINAINVDNKKINIQLARHDNNIIVGTPLILGSY